MVETNLNTRFDGRNMKVDSIQDKWEKLQRKMLWYKFNHRSRVNLVPTGFLHVAYVMAVQGRKLNLCEIIRLRLLDNIAKVKKTKSTVFRFESLLTHYFSMLQGNFLEWQIGIEMSAQWIWWLNAIDQSWKMLEMMTLKKWWKFSSQRWNRGTGYLLKW